MALYKSHENVIYMLEKFKIVLCPMHTMQVSNAIENSTRN